MGGSKSISKREVYYSNTILLQEREKSQINQTLHLKQLEKEQQTQS